MIELALAWAGGLLLGVALTLGFAHERWAADVDAARTPSFEDVCYAAARAKEHRRQEETLSSDYVDGTDDVLGELLAHFDVSPAAMQTAYLAGGEDVDLLTDANNPLASDESMSADEMDAHLPDDRNSVRDVE